MCDTVVLQRCYVCGTGVLQGCYVCGTGFGTRGVRGLFYNFLNY